MQHIVSSLQQESVRENIKHKMPLKQQERVLKPIPLASLDLAPCMRAVSLRVVCAGCQFPVMHPVTD